MRTHQWPGLADLAPGEGNKVPGASPGTEGTFFLSENMEKMTQGECRDGSLSWSTVSKWSLGNRGRTQSRAFPSTFPNAVAGHLQLLDWITWGNSHKPSLLLLVLCQSWQILVWNIRRHDSSSFLRMLLGAGPQTQVHKAQLKSRSREAQHMCHHYAQGTRQLDSSPRCHRVGAPSYTMPAAPELQQKVAVMSKGDKRLLQVKTRFVSAILPKTLSPLLRTKEGCYNRYDNCNGLLP